MCLHEKIHCGSAARTCFNNKHDNSSTLNTRAQRNVLGKERWQIVWLNSSHHRFDQKCKRHRVLLQLWPEVSSPTAYGLLPTIRWTVRPSTHYRHIPFSSVLFQDPRSPIARHSVRAAVYNGIQGYLVDSLITWPRSKPIRWSGTQNLKCGSEKMRYIGERTHLLHRCNAMQCCTDECDTQLPGGRCGMRLMHGGPQRGELCRVSTSRR